MKNIFILLLLAIISLAKSQVIIGDAIGTIPANQKSSVLLEFAIQNKGIIVPYVRSLPTGAALVGGSIILDATNASTARMKFYNGTTWVDLSGQDANITAALATQPTGITEFSDAKAIIGAPSSSADGVLILESNTKAMVLPTVGTIIEGGNTKVNIPSPSPGMMVYVINSQSGTKRLAVYNGNKWSFWMP